MSGDRITSGNQNVALQRSRRRNGYLAFFINGMLAVLTANLMNLFLTEYGYRYSDISFCLALQSMGNLCMVALSGWLITKVGQKRCQVMFCILFIAGCLLIQRGDILLCVQAGMLVTGIGWGMCNNIIHLSIRQSGKTTSSMNLLHMSYALGSFAGPYLMAVFLEHGIHWDVLTMFLIAATIFLLVLFLTTSSPENKESLVQSLSEEQRPQQNQSLRKEMVSHTFLICFFLYFCYVGIEGAVNTWLVTYLQNESQFSLSFSQKMLSLFWVIIIMVRLVNIRVLKRCKLANLLILQGIGILIFMGLVIANLGSTISVIAVIGLALCMGGISPCNALNAKKYMEGAGRLSGIIFAGGGLGSVILPIMIGTMAQNYSLKMGMFSIFLIMLIFTVIAIWNRSCHVNAEEITRNNVR